MGSGSGSGSTTKYRHTFSLAFSGNGNDANDGDMIGHLYTESKDMDIGVASVFRYHLMMYAASLKAELNSLSKSEHSHVLDVANLLSATHMARDECFPKIDLIKSFLKTSGRGDLVPFVTKSSVIRMALIMTLARRVASTGEPTLWEVT